MLPGFGDKTLYAIQTLIAFLTGQATRASRTKSSASSIQFEENSITEDHLDGSIRNLSASIQSFQPKVEPAPKSPTSRSLPDAVEQLECRLIEEALQNSGSNKQKAAHVLGLSRQGLIKKLKWLQIGVSAD